MYISGNLTHALWADTLAARYAPGWVVDLYTPLRGKPRKYVYGHANLTDRRIELCVTSPEQTPELLWVVLHEIAHAMHADSPEYVRPVRVRGRFPRNSLHPPEFWKLAIPLYVRYGALDFAAVREYRIGLPLIKAEQEKLALVVA